MLRRTVALTVGALTLTACQPSLSPTGGPLGHVAVMTSKAGMLLFRGQVSLPRGFGVNATSADILDRATVTLLDNAGSAVAAGLTDNAGAFTLYKSTVRFVPADGETFTLDVTKSVADGSDLNLLTLRTVVQYRREGWTSITGAHPIRINLTTTAVALMQQEGGIAAAAVIETVQGANLDEVTAGGPFTGDAVSARQQRLNLDLTSARNPVGDRTFIWGGDYTISDEQSLKAFSNVEEIHGDLVINSDLTTLKLPSLRYVSGKLLIGDAVLGYRNPTLQTVELRRLTSVGHSVTIAENRDLQTLDLSQLTRIGGRLRVAAAPPPATAEGSLVIMNNDGLRDLSGLKKLRLMAGKLELNNNRSLENGDGLAGVSGQLQTIMIRQCNRLKSLDLSGVTDVIGEAYIEDSGLEHLNGLAGLTTVGSNLYVSGLPDLMNIEGLGRLTSVGGNLTVQGTPQVTKLAGLTALTNLGGNLTINVRDLTNETGLHGLTAVGGNVTITGCDSLADLSLLARVTTITGGLALDNCRRLGNLSGLERLERIGGRFAINACHGLTSLAGAPLLTEVQGNLNIKDNDNPAFTLTGLNVTTVGGNLIIWLNDFLPNLDGLQGITSLAGDLTIAGNPALVDVSALSGTLRPAGRVEVSNNGPGCPAGSAWPLP